MLNKYIAPNYIEDIISNEFDQRTDDVYESLGRFLISFEDLLGWMTKAIKNILIHNGHANTEKGGLLLDVMLSEMEAIKIVKRYVALFIIEFPHKEKELKYFGTRVIKLVEKRNEIVHGKFIIHAGPEDGKNFRGYNHKTGFSFDKRFKAYENWYFKEAYNESQIYQTYLTILRIIYNFNDIELWDRFTEDNIKNQTPIAGCKLYDPKRFK